MNPQATHPAPPAQVPGAASHHFWQSPSLGIYLGLAAVMVVLAILQLVLPLTINAGQQMSLAVVLAVAVLGWAGVILAPRAGFPEMNAPGVAVRQRVWVPLAAGIALGAVMVLGDFVNPLGTEVQTPFPDSLVVFALAGLFEEIAIHLFLTTTLVWLISAVILRGRRQDSTFWFVAIGTAALYWFVQIYAIMSFFPDKFSPMLAVQMAFVIGATITVGAWFYRRAGFLAALALRYGFYLVWHILWAGGIGLIGYMM
jgi:hypothetical protein